MKISKLLLVISALTLMACGSRNKTSENTTSVESTTSVQESTSILPISITAISSSIEADSSTSEVSSSSDVASSVSSSVSSSSNEVTNDTTVAVNLFNPTCGSMSTEVLNDRLASYINGLATTPFVTSITNSRCQISANIPENGQSVLIIGSAQGTGSLSFTFNVTVKKVSIVAQPYYKPWVDTWTNPDEPIVHPNVDTNSALQIAGKGTDPVVVYDLAPVNEQPTEKTIDLDIDSTTLILNSLNAEKGRVFIKSITFVY